MPTQKTIKIFLASSIDELENERLRLADYINSSVKPIFANGEVDVSLFKCEDHHSGNLGGSSQTFFDEQLKSSDISIFLFKTKAGDATLREFDLARQLQKEKRHEIYVYCFDVPEDEKTEALKDLQQRLIKEELYWRNRKNIEAVKADFVLGLVSYERALRGFKATHPKTPAEKGADARFERYVKTEDAQAEERKKLHQDIDALLQQAKTVMEDENDTIAGRILRTINLYKKADLWAETTDYDKEKHFYLLLGYAEFLDRYGLYNEAMEVYVHQMIPLAKSLHELKHVYTATTYNNIGEVYRKQGDYSKALKYFLKALAIREKALGTDHSATAASFNNIGGVYIEQGDYSKALEYLLKSSAIIEKEQDTEHVDIANNYNNIGLVYWKQGNYTKALEYYTKALAILEKELGTEHLDTAIAYNNLGSLYWDQGDLPKALKYYFKALAIWEKVLGTEHPNTATIYNNIGTVYDRQGDYPKALKYYFKALAIDEKVLGKEHPNTASDYHNIGWVYKTQGNYPKAMEYLKKSLKIFIKKLGKEHPTTQKTQERFDATQAAMEKE